jgi:hypothetical protein
MTHPAKVVPSVPDCVPIIWNELGQEFAAAPPRMVLMLAYGEFTDANAVLTSVVLRVGSVPAVNV